MEGVEGGAGPACAAQAGSAFGGERPVDEDADPAAWGDCERILMPAVVGEAAAQGPAPGPLGGVGVERGARPAVAAQARAEVLPALAGPPLDAHAVRGTLLERQGEGAGRTQGAVREEESLVRVQRVRRHMRRAEVVDAKPQAHPKVGLARTRPPAAEHLGTNRMAVVVRVKGEGGAGTCVLHPLGTRLRRLGLLPPVQVQLPVRLPARLPSRHAGRRLAALLAAAADASVRLDGEMERVELYETHGVRTPVGHPHPQRTPPEGLGGRCRQRLARRAAQRRKGLPCRIRAPPPAGAQHFASALDAQPDRALRRVTVGEFVGVPWAGGAANGAAGDHLLAARRRRAQLDGVCLQVPQRDPAQACARLDSGGG